MTYWRCNVCGYVHDGDGPPMICPKCGVGAEEFEVMEQKSSSLGVEEDWLLRDDDGGPPRF